jgi:hypothetical protein
MNHPEILEEAIKIGGACKIEDWMDLKKILLVSLPSPARKYFSIRDPKTKGQRLNDFERWLIDSYSMRTGLKLNCGKEK